VSTDLERQIDRELTRLPAPRAPGTLLPRVMHAVRTTEPRPSGWFTWPLSWQVASLALMVLALAGAARLWPVAIAGMSLIVSQSAMDLGGRFSALSRVVTDAAGAAGTIWSVVQPIVSGMVLLLTVMCGACAVFGAALRAVVLGGPSR
jgi:hypothetical protein